jgi:hypothetical protein
MSAPTYEGTTPLISDRYIITMIAGEDLAIGDLVELTSAWTVKKPTAANSLKIVGLCLTKASNGSKVSVVARGVCRAKAYGAIAAGDQLTSAPANAPGSIYTDNTSKNTSVLGTAVEAIASGATGVILLW